MPTETYPTGSTFQPEDGAENLHEQGSDLLVNYSDRKEYLGRSAAGVALEVFGNDLRRPGMFFTKGGGDLDVPYRVECHGDGDIVTFDVYDSDIYGGTAVGQHGLDGYVISKSTAQRMAAA